MLTSSTSNAEKAVLLKESTSSKIGAESKRIFCPDFFSSMPRGVNLSTQLHGADRYHVLVEEKKIRKEIEHLPENFPYKLTGLIGQGSYGNVYKGYVGSLKHLN
jgi:hypothetical protein